MKTIDARQRRFVTGSEAVKTTRQHKKPCADCPFARVALNGWLGTLTAQEWLEAAHGEAKIDCHTATVQCAGAAIFRSNICKMPKDQTLLLLPADRKLVFGWNDEFLAHHSKMPTRNARHSNAALCDGGPQSVESK